MGLSVVVPTLNGRDELVDCLDALAAHVAPEETIVVNGPSADGTTGTVRERDDVDVLVELADRNVNAARNAGIEAARGDVVGFVDERTVVDRDWLDAVESALSAGAEVVTGPIRRPMRVGTETTAPERSRVAGRDVAYFDGGNVVLTAAVLGRLDGFDEYLAIGGSRDAAHRLAGLGLGVEWSGGMVARRGDAGGQAGDGQDGDGDDGRGWAWKYRSLAYRLFKNYGPSPRIGASVLRHALDDGIGALRDVLDGSARPSEWVGNGRDVLAGGLRGAGDGLAARRRDPTPRRNPNGVSAREDRAVKRYDRRE